MAEIAPVTRRSFLAAVGLTAGLALGWFPSSEASAAEAGFEPNVFVHVAPDGTVTVICHRSEMGQGVRSTIPVLIADELGADLARVVVVQAIGDKKYGDQNTDGSSSIRKGDEKLRQMAAVARTVLISAAAREWKVQPGTCVARDHAVHHPPSGRSLGFGALALPASRLPLPKTAVLRPWAELTRVNAETLPLLDGEAIVDGTAVYGADVSLVGLKIAVIARPPVVGGTIARFDPAPALAVPGVRAVIPMPTPTAPWGFQVWGGLAVVADHTWAAIRGRAALDVTWDDGPNAVYGSPAYKEALLGAVRAPGTPHRIVGDAEAALAEAAKVIEAEYFVPHLAHLPMEPPVAVARVVDGVCEIWTSTQNPQVARTTAAQILGIDEAAVTVHVTLLGGGFGRKSKADFVAEAAFLAREVGAPVRVQWTREDDIRHGYYNAVNAQRLQAGLDPDGKIVAWHQRTAFPPIASTFGDAPEPKIGDLQQGVLDLALDVPNVRAEACSAAAHVRIGWFRSVYNIFHAFSAGCFVDELAAARGVDPREQWLELIGPPRALDLAALGVASLRNYGETLERHPVDVGRLRRVIERVTASAGWAERGGRALGLAAHRSFVSYTAVVMSVIRDDQGRVRIDEAWIAMDPGTVVNRDRVRSQMEGAVVMGISNALYGGITMTAGRTDPSNFRDARIARIGDVPRQIHVDLVLGEGPPGGVGEPGVPPVAPALANAIFALTGTRLREIPFAPQLG